MTARLADYALLAACDVLSRAMAEPARVPRVEAFFNEATCTISYVVSDPASGACAVIDSVLDFDAPSACVSHDSADAVTAYVHENQLSVQWLLETHVHADHLSASRHIQRQRGGKLGIGQGIVAVQEVFGELFSAGTDFTTDRRDFDHLFQDGDRFTIGGIEAVVLHVPGHTPADVAFVIGDSVFVGDTLLMPDYGTARADFPGGDARQLFRSIRRLLCLSADARVYVCHDYKAPGRDRFAWQTTIRAQREGNVQAHDGIAEDDYVASRQARDATLAVPKLMLQSVQVNIRGGRLPDPEANGVRYLRIPLNMPLVSIS